MQPLLRAYSRMRDMKVVRSAASASHPCLAFASTLSAEAAAAHAKGSRLPSLPALKGKWCSRSAAPPAATLRGTRAIPQPPLPPQLVKARAPAIPQQGKVVAKASQNSLRMDASAPLLQDTEDPDAWWPAQAPVPPPVQASQGFHQAS